jgi:hypothetical protein
MEVMTRMRRGSIITGIAAVGFLGTAVLHSTGYSWITQLAEQSPGVLRTLAPALWLSFALDLVVIGLILAVLAVRPCAIARPLLVVASLCPIGAAMLQLRFLGFVPPTGILFGVGALTLVAAAVTPPSRADRRGSA